MVEVVIGIRGDLASPEPDLIEFLRLARIKIRDSIQIE
jgi:hypothetical protein